MLTSAALFITAALFVFWPPLFVSAGGITYVHAKILTFVFSQYEWRDEGKMAVITIKIQNEDSMTLGNGCQRERMRRHWSTRKNTRRGDEIIFGDLPEKCLLRTDGGRCARGGNRLCDRGTSLRIPFGERKIFYSPKTFREPAFNHRKACGYDMLRLPAGILQKCDGPAWGDQLLSACAWRMWRRAGRRCSAARNAIDGVTVNDAHGEWPYESWGINRREDANMRLEFGRKVAVSRIRLVHKGGFPAR